MTSRRKATFRATARARLRAEVLTWCASAQSFLAVLRAQTGEMVGEIDRAGSPLREFLHPSEVQALVNGLDLAWDAITGIHAPPAGLPLPGPRAIVKDAG